MNSCRLIQENSIKVFSIYPTSKFKINHEPKRLHFFVWKSTDAPLIFCVLYSKSDNYIYWCCARISDCSALCFRALSAEIKWKCDDKFS